MSKPENPPAFPLNEGFGIPKQGMTLRDWFAGQALNGLCAGNKTIYENDENIALKYPTAFANFAYKFADSMLKERSDEG